MNVADAHQALTKLQSGAADVAEHILERLKVLGLIRLNEGGWRLTEAGQAVLDAFGGKIH